MKYPTFKIEKELKSRGHFVIGVDEVGCGALAGPVIAAAIHLPLNFRLAAINDSKLLKPHQREEIFALFVRRGLQFTIGMATHKEVDKLNVRQASLLAMKRAVSAFRGATFALVDAWKIPGIKMQQRGIIHGDRLVKSIAAASIVAKVVRDRLMSEFDADFPGYFLKKHKGYGTRLHYDSIKKMGPSPLHRRTFLKKTGFAS
ncbi:ribonuclease HII [Candidatus Peregrinibacteria bacterium]|nr:ribonuclease HII [Candidatus Peregrinibacteria bacterium]